jgi:hypothetical protein
MAKSSRPWQSQKLFAAGCPVAIGRFHLAESKNSTSSKSFQRAEYVLAHARYLHSSLIHFRPLSSLISSGVLSSLINSVSNLCRNPLHNSHCKSAVPLECAWCGGAFGAFSRTKRDFPQKF